MVKAYFAACEREFPARRAELRRIALALCRGGVARMEQLCVLQRSGPEGLLEIRSIGAKSLPLIAAVCALCLGLLPTAAFALDGDKTIMLGTSVLQKNANTADAATVYFGRKEDGNPAAWRVISYK